METSSIIALSRQGVLRRKLDNIATNMANMNTGGFKAERMMFTNHVVDNRNADGVRDRKINLVRDVAAFLDTREGPIVQTGNQLDLAISGNAYFKVQTPEGERYTRNGSFTINNAGQLVNQGGHAVLSDAGQPFFFAPEDSDIAIAADGTLSTENGTLGKIDLVRFENEQTLLRTGNGLFDSTAAPIANENATIIQGAIEKSNVEPVVEITRLIEVHRAYTSVQKFIDKEDERIKGMIQVLGDTR